MKAHFEGGGLIHVLDTDGNPKCLGEHRLALVLIKVDDSEPTTCGRCARIAGRTPKVEATSTYPTVFAFMDTETGEIFVSAYESDDPLWENNYAIVKDARGSKHESVLNILQNVMFQARVRLHIET